MTPNTTRTPTAYWVIRTDDEEPVGLYKTEQQANQHAEQFEQDTGEPYRVSPDHREEIPKSDLPDTWLPDWEHRVPDTVTIVDTEIQNERG